MLTNGFTVIMIAICLILSHDLPHPGSNYLSGKTDQADQVFRDLENGQKRLKSVDFSRLNYVKASSLVRCDVSNSISEPHIPLFKLVNIAVTSHPLVENPSRMSLTHNEISQNQGLRIYLEALKSKYQVGEPLALTIRLRNEGQNIICLESRVLDINYGDVHVEYRLKNKEKLTFVPIFNRDCIAGGLSFNLPPNSEITEQYWLLYQPRLEKFIFDEPGDYEVQVNLALNYSEKIYSNVVKVKVSQVPTHEQKAFALFKDPDLAQFAVGFDPFWTTTEEFEVRLDKAVIFLEKNPQSFYSSMVRTQLSQTLSFLKSREDVPLSPKIQAYCKKFLIEKNLK